MKRKKKKFDSYGSSGHLRPCFWSVSHSFLILFCVLLHSLFFPLPPLAVSKLILVQQPFMERRVMATFLHQWPEPKGHTCAVITSPRSDMASYPNASVGSKHDLICYMLGNTAQTGTSYVSRCKWRSRYNFLCCGLMSDFFSPKCFLGVLERIRDYPQRGYQVKQDISSEAMLAYQWFLQAGYRPQ